jgi:hypothetical protein
MPPPPVWLAVAVLLVQAAALVLVLVLPLADAADQAARGLPNRATACGDVPVPYPFGLGAGCYHYSPGFNLTCDTSQAAPRLLLGTGAFQVLDISLANATVRAARTGGVTVSLGDGRGVWRGLPDPGPLRAERRRQRARRRRGLRRCSRSSAAPAPAAATSPSAGARPSAPARPVHGRRLLPDAHRNRLPGLRRAAPAAGPEPAAAAGHQLAAAGARLGAEQGWLREAAASTRGAPLPVNVNETSVPVLLSWAMAAAALGRNKTLWGGTKRRLSLCPMGLCTTIFMSKNQDHCHGATG